MKQDELTEVLKQHKEWLEDNDKGKRANLRNADLRNANLRNANLDFSVFPLWCGGTRFMADDKLVAQLLAHVCSLQVSDKAREELNKILDFAETSHRAKECALI